MTKSFQLTRVICVFAAAWFYASVSSATAPEILTVTRAELHQMGIGIDTSGFYPDALLPVPPSVAKPFPNRCFGLITVSDELLNSMKSAGFSLQTLCLGLKQSHVAFHPETGAPLTRVRVKFEKEDGGIDLLIDIPRCFARGTPYVDCKTRYNYMGGGREEGNEYWESGKHGQDLLAAIRRLRLEETFKRICGCGDLQATEAGGVERKPAKLCRVDRLPDCPKLRSKSAPPSSLLVDIRDPSFADMRRAFASKGIDDIDFTSSSLLLNEEIEVSPELPLGFAHTWMTPEGDNEAVIKAPTKGRKLSIGTR